MVSTPESKPCLAIVGPTASGKSALAVELAARIDGEIISCDSIQLYRGFDVGSAKPSPEVRSRVAHHLLDVVECDASFDAQRYVELADRALANIRSRRRTAILCGGTGLYLRAFRYGLVALPEPPPGLREALHREERESPGILYRRLTERDPESAQTIEPNNTVYVVRALEIMTVTGRKASEVRREHGFRAPRHNLQVLALEWPRAELRARLRSRVNAMIDAGLLEEVRGLLAMGVSSECRAMRSVGYRQAVEVLQGRRPPDTLAEAIERSTWTYARRQRTWLRRERDVHRIAVDGQSSIDTLPRVLEILAAKTSK